MSKKLIHCGSWARSIHLNHPLSTNHYVPSQDGKRAKKGFRQVLYKLVSRQVELPMVGQFSAEFSRIAKELGELYREKLLEKYPVAFIHLQSSDAGEPYLNFSALLSGGELPRTKLNAHVDPDNRMVHTLKGPRTELALNSLSFVDENLIPDIEGSPFPTGNVVWTTIPPVDPATGELVEEVQKKGDLAGIQVPHSVPSRLPEDAVKYTVSAPSGSSTTVFDNYERVLAIGMKMPWDYGRLKKTPGTWTRAIGRAGSVLDGEKITIQGLKDGFSAGLGGRGIVLERLPGYREDYIQQWPALSHFRQEVWRYRWAPPAV